MTIKEICKQIYSLSMDGKFNDERYTRSEFERAVRRLFDGGKDTGIFRATLPDGTWFVKVSRLSNGEYGYIVPENAEQEKYIADEYHNSREVGVLQK